MRWTCLPKAACHERAGIKTGSAPSCVLLIEAIPVVRFATRKKYDFPASL